MTRMITAMFDSRSAAEAAATQLVRAMGLDRDAVRLHGGNAERAEAGMATEAGEERGFWATLRDMFVPDEDRTTYAEGLRRGAFLVSAEIDESRVDEAMDALEAHGAIDLDSREAQWRAAGGSGVAGTTDEPVIARPGGAGGSLSNHPAPGSMTNEEGRLAGAGLAGATPSGRSVMSPPVPAPAPSSQPAGAKPMAGAGGEVIPVVEERGRIGKRDMERGRVRVRSYVFEPPAGEQVSPQEERGEVERRRGEAEAENEAAPRPSGARHMPRKT